MRVRELAALAPLLAFAGCPAAHETDDEASASTSAEGSESGTGTTSGASESSEGASASESSESTGEVPDLIERWVEVTLDGEPVAGAIVMQGGIGVEHPTDAEGRVLVPVDTTIPGDLGLIATHPEARARGSFVTLDDASPMQFALTRFSTTDNPEYPFNDPGVPGSEGTTLQCGHCHAQLKDDWHGSPHRRSASNPVVHDVYAGVAAAWSDEATCTSAGGQWWQGRVPGSDRLAPRCYLGFGTLPDLDGSCGQSSACDLPGPDAASDFGGCADCHAPAIDGTLGGRDLLDAIGVSHDAGVHCDLCHKVESVTMDAAPGVAGRLGILRPSEPSMSPGVGNWQPLAFGPYPDVPNPRMGAVARELFHEAELCGACHQLEQAALVPGAALDPTRWPSATLPIHTTYDEWASGPFADVSPCSGCHMPADPLAGNGADLEAIDIPLQGFARGWLRPPGSVREHTFVGPRTPASGMLQLAAALLAEVALVDGTLTVELRVRNVGAGHAIPTGEPQRALLVFVRARCGDVEQPAIDGDAIPDFGGWLDRRAAPADWDQWPGAALGDVVRVVDVDGFVDYEGFGPFGDGSFDAAQKGLPRLRVVGQATITAVQGDQVEFDAPLPVGDLAFRGRPDIYQSGDASLAQAVAGAPGFAFARVLVDAQGNTMVPHHRAVDVASDNRILPQHESSSTHVFAVACADPIVEATLVHRPYDVALARERGWANVQQVMATIEVSP